MSRLLAISANSAWNLVNFRRGLLLALMDRGFRIVALVPAGNGVAELEKIGIAVRPIPMSPLGLSPLSDLRLLLGYRKHLRTLEPAAFLGFTAKPNIYGSLAARWNGTPVIANITGLGTGFLSGRTLELIVSHLYRAALAKAEMVFFHNPDDRDLFVGRRLVEAARSKVIPGSGVDLDYFNAQPSAGNAEPTFLFIGRFLKDKGIVEFVEAAKQVKVLRPTIRIRALGAAEAHPKSISPETAEYWKQEGMVEFLLPAGDVRPYIAEVDCVVLPSYREGLPRVLLEASAMAKALIGSDVPGCRQVVEDGVTGFLCEPRSSSALANAMIRFADLSPEQRVSMGHAARLKAEQEFGEERVIGSYMSALETILSKPGPKELSS